MSQRFPAAARNSAATFVDLATIVFLLLFTMLSLAMFGNLSAPGGQPRLRIPMPRIFAPASPPPGPSLYDLESAMPEKTLIDRWTPYIREASTKLGMPESWIRAVIRQESGGRTVSEGDVPITSNAGAEGLMQVMPETYEDMRAQYGLGANTYDPHDNVIAGTAYMRWLYKRYGFPRMFAAYNDGPGNFDKAAAGKRGLPAETVAYLASITAELGPKHRHLMRA